MRGLIRSIAVALAIGLAWPVLADPVGTFAVVGKNEKGVAYRGTVVIARTGETYRLNWSLGRDHYTGIGIGATIGKEGFLPTPASPAVTVLTVAYGTSAGFGVAQFIQQQDGSWLGAWAPSSSRVVSEERWVPQTL
jgi:hypothetical protein